ncbi:MAG: TonB-dependent receptor [Pseudomonadota bacterium]
MGALIAAGDTSATLAQANQIFNALRAPDKAETDGVIYKLTGTWTPTTDLLFYATYSEGFRPGLLNRPGGAAGPNGFTVPFAVDTDEVQNYEIGWKTELFDNSLRFNGSAFFVEVEGLQTQIFDPSITNLFFSDNAANAEIQGIEGDFTWAPETIDGLTLAGAFSLLDTEITEVLTPTQDVIEGSDLAFAPAYQGNLRARYEWDLERRIAGSSLTAHIMPQIVFSDDSRSDIIEINAADIDGYVTLGGTLGVTADQWSAELFATNLTNEYAELSNTFINDRERVTPMRPRTLGVRVAYDF